MTKTIELKNYIKKIQLNEKEKDKENIKMDCSDHQNIKINNSTDNSQIKDNIKNIDEIMVDNSNINDKNNTMNENKNINEQNQNTKSVIKNTSLTNTDIKSDNQDNDNKIKSSEDLNQELCTEDMIIDSENGATARRTKPIPAGIMERYKRKLKLRNRKLIEQVMKLYQCEFTNGHIIPTSTKLTSETAVSTHINSNANRKRKNIDKNEGKLNDSSFAASNKKKIK